jgi:uncharacterized protein YlxW (UPF0749 family)
LKRFLHRWQTAAGLDWHTQVVELQKALEQERQLRTALADHVKETQQAVADAAAVQATQARVMEQAAAIQVIARCFTFFMVG